MQVATQLNSWISRGMIIIPIKKEDYSVVGRAKIANINFINKAQNRLVRPILSILPPNPRTRKFSPANSPSGGEAAAEER